MDAQLEQLVERFRRMVARAGGELTLLAAGADVVRVRYRAAAADSDCVDGACVLPERELEQLMTETLARQRPGTRVEIEVGR
jgi:hypothetical protein